MRVNTERPRVVDARLGVTAGLAPGAGPSAGAGLAAGAGLRPRFVRLLQLAYSGELGAAVAYGGHAASVTDPAERRRILEIRSEELDHRDRVGRMLGQLGSRPDPRLEARYRRVGSGIAAFCGVGGWFLPMYGAGWIENQNIAEYERAARLGALCGEDALADELLLLAEVEWEHERFFRLKAASHPLARVLRVWRAPAPKAAIRRHFAQASSTERCVSADARLEAGHLALISSTR